MSSKYSNLDRGLAFAFSVVVLLALFVMRQQMRPPAPEETPFDAARLGHLPVLVRMVLKDRSVLEVKDDMQRTLLHHAAEGNQIPVIDYLLTEGADISARDRTGNFPLHDAAKYGSLSALRRLIAAGTDFKALAVSPIPGIPLSLIGGNSALELAATYGRLEVVKFLLANGALTSRPEHPGGTTALHRACEMGLSRQGTQAFNDEHLATIDLLAKHIDINNEGGAHGTPLHEATRFANVLVVLHLLDNYPTIDVDVRNYDGNTPLHLAVLAFGRDEIPDEDVVEIVQRLLKHGAKIDVVNREGKTPTDLAWQFGKPRLVQLLSESR